MKQLFAYIGGALALLGIGGLLYHVFSSKTWKEIWHTDKEILSRRKIEVKAEKEADKIRKEAEKASREAKLKVATEEAIKKAKDELAKAPKPA